MVTQDASASPRTAPRALLLNHLVAALIESALMARRARDRSNRTSEAHQYTDNVAGTFWSSTQTGSGPNGAFTITFGVGFDNAQWFRGRATRERQVSTCPDESCCKRPPTDLSDRWADSAWPSARMHARVLATLPSGRFPGVDDTEVFEFLERHAESP